MPFISPERREMIKEETLKDWQPGDYCYLFYKGMVDEWKISPRWTTAHNIHKRMKHYLIFELDGDKKIAYELAWQVFFIKHVMPCEEEREKINGSI